MNEKKKQAIGKAELAAGIQVLAAVAEVIREAGSIPSGSLYAAIMPTGITLDVYQAILRRLTGAGLVRDCNNVLTWIGPAIEKNPAKQSEMDKQRPE